MQSAERLVLLVGDRLVLTGGGPVRAVDRNSGKTIWTSEQTSDNVVAQNGFVYAYLKDSREIVCLQMTDGKQIWRQQYKEINDPKHKDVRLRTVIDGVLICGSVDAAQRIYAMSAKDGAFLWTRLYTVYAHGEGFLEFFRGLHAALRIPRDQVGHCNRTGRDAWNSGAGFMPHCRSHAGGSAVVIGQAGMLGILARTSCRTADPTRAGRPL